MALFLDTTVNGNMTVNGNITIGENETPVLDIINKNFNNLVKLFAERRILDYTTSTPDGGEWEIDSSGVTLVGNILRLSGKVTRSSAPKGNIANEKTMIFTINHGGLITNVYNMCFANGATGNFSSWYTQNSTDGDTTTVTIVFSGTRDINTATSFGFYVHMPVDLNTEYYDTLNEDE